MNYSKAIRVTRALADLSQRELAEQLGVDPSYVSMLEKGSREVTPEILKKIANKLNAPVSLFTLIAAEQQDVNETAGRRVSQLGKALAEVYFANHDTTRPAHRAAKARKSAASRSKVEP
jgi:transcriptional regulator with XRE-family HTH domain